MDGLEEDTSASNQLPEDDNESAFVSPPDGMLSHENEELRNRVSALEKKVESQDDEIVCLKSALSDVIRRVSSMESGRALQNSALPSKPKITVNSPGRRMGPPAGSRSSAASRGRTASDLGPSKYSTPTPNRIVPRTGAGTSSGSSTPGSSRKWPSVPAMNAPDSNGHISPSSPGPRYSLGSAWDENPGLGASGSLVLGSTPSLNYTPPTVSKFSRVSTPAGAVRAPSTPQGSTAAVRRSGSLTSLSGRQSPSPYPIRHREPVFNEGDKSKSKVEDDKYLRFYLRGKSLNFYMPSSVEDYQANNPLPAPQEKLRLEWAYGYRGRDARCNLYLLPTGEVVYFIASVVVLYNVEEQMQRHYLGHTDDVKCIAIHPDRMRIASGQVAGHDRRDARWHSSATGRKRDKYSQPHVRIWNSVNLQTLRVIGAGDFDRAVACLAFSKADGGQFLAAVDEANEHVLSLWDWEKGQKVTETKSSTDPVLAAEFHPCEKNLIVTCGKGQISFWCIDGGTLTRKQGIYEKHDKPKFVTCVAFAENGDVLSGDSNGNFYIWGRDEIEEGSNRITVAHASAHDSGLFSILVMRDGTILTGGRDRRIVQWTADYKKTGLEHELPEQYGPVRMLSQGKGNSILAGTTKNAILQGSLDLKFSAVVQGHTDELWGLASHPNQHQFVTCGYDKVLYYWDALTHTAIWSKEMPDGAHCAAIHPEGSLVAVGTVCGRWLVIDATTRDTVTSHTDGNEPLECMAFSPDGRFLAIGSRDNIVYVYSAAEGGRKYSRIGKCTGHSSFITHIDWSTDSQFLVSNSGDYEVLYWNASTTRQITSASSMKDVDWATNTCTLGFNVCGMWPEGADGTDINSCCRANTKALLVSGDDLGKVNLFTYPCNQPKSAGNPYNGHSSHVTSVRFLHDDSRLLSTGGKDTAILQWELVA